MHAHALLRASVSEIMSSKRKQSWERHRGGVQWSIQKIVKNSVHRPSVTEAHYNVASRLGCTACKRMIALIASKHVTI